MEEVSGPRAQRRFVQGLRKNPVRDGFCEVRLGRLEPRESAIEFALRPRRIVCQFTLYGIESCFGNDGIPRHRANRGRSHPHPSIVVQRMPPLP